MNLLWLLAELVLLPFEWRALRRAFGGPKGRARLLYFITTLALIVGASVAAMFIGIFYVLGQA